MSVTWAWCGAPSPSSFRVVAKTTGANARLAVSTSPDLSSPIYFGPVSPGAAGTVSITATGLDPDTQFHWAVEDDGVLDIPWQGKARTHGAVGSPYSFTFAAAGDAGLTGAPGDASFITSQVSNKPVFDTIRTHNPLFFVHLGDLHYRNITSGAVADYRTAYQDVLTFNGTEGSDARQGKLYRNHPTIVFWDDHDYSGDNSDGTYAGKAAASQAYRECVPSYSLADDEATFHSWQVGRVLFVALDVRYYRSPNSDPDSPSKTMLGPAQLSWLEQLLSSSTAKALIVCSPVQWLSSFSDSWGGFAYERGVLQGLFQHYGWADRMLMIQADKHSLGLDTGTNNTWGGFPNALLASLDCGGGDDTGPYDLGITGGRDRYGLINVTDDGDQIRITTTGYIASAPWKSMTLVVTTPSEEPPPSPAPPITIGTVQTRVTWHACNLVTGGIIAELPDITGTVSRVLGEYTSSALTLPIPESGPGHIPRSVWEGATQPGTTMLVAVVNDVPTWAGIVLTRQGGTGPTLSLGTVSLEGYLARRYVGNHTWTQRDEASVIAAGLLADANAVQGIGLIVDAPATGTLRDRTYEDRDDATVYDRLRELMGVEDGPEWTIDVDWATSAHTSIAKIVRVYKRIGVDSTSVAVFSAKGVYSSTGESSATYEYAEDFTDGRGANYIIATGSGEGEDRPQSSPKSGVTGAWPRYERRFTPSTSISSVSVLNSHASAELALRRDGGRVLELSARWDTHPRYGIDWRLGDDVGYELTGHRHPDGFDGIARVIGFELDMQAGVIKPKLLLPGEEEA